MALHPDFAPYEPPLDEFFGRAEPRKASGPPRFILEPLADIVPTLTGSWLVKGLLPSHGLAVVYGPPGCGKSFVTLDAALHIAAGRSWAGCKVKPGGVVYVASEGGAGFRKRVAAARREHEIDPAAPFALVTTAPNLGVAQGDGPELVRCIRDQARALGWHPSVVVLDTLARSIPGADENSAKDLGVFVANADSIAKDLGVVVVVVHHAGKSADKGMRGSSALHGAADCEWEVVDGEAGRSIKLAKMKDGADDLVVQFNLMSVEIGRDEDGDPVSTCFVEVRAAHVDDTAKVSRRPAVKGQQAEFLKGVRMAIGDMGEVPATCANIPARVRCVSRLQLSIYADKLGFLREMTPKVRKSTLDRLVRTLCGGGHLGQWGDWIWVP